MVDINIDEWKTKDYVDFNLLAAKLKKIELDRIGDDIKIYEAVIRLENKIEELEKNQKGHQHSVSNYVRETMGLPKYHNDADDENTDIKNMTTKERVELYNESLDKIKEIMKKPHITECEKAVVKKELLPTHNLYAQELAKYHDFEEMTLGCNIKILIKKQDIPRFKQYFGYNT